MSTLKLPTKRQLPKLMACVTRASREKMRVNYLNNVTLLDFNFVRRQKYPLHECMINELKEAGFNNASDYLRDLIEDNIEFVKADELGIVIDLRKRPDYLERLNAHLRRAEEQYRKDDTKKETLLFLEEANYFADKEKGILWLAEKLYLAAIAISMRYMVDGGRLKGCCQYHYAKFLLDKFPGADTGDSFNLLITVRNGCYGKPWLLWEPDEETKDPEETLIRATCVQLHRVLLMESKGIRKLNINKSETLARLAERRAGDANDKLRMSEAVLEIGICQLLMNNLNNAQKTFERAYKMFQESDNFEGQCETNMNLAAVMQRKGEYEVAEKLLTDMGTLAIQKNLPRHLGRALHFLGELYLRQERPELGTIHLLEAFWCFMGAMEDLRAEPLENENLIQSRVLASTSALDIFTSKMHAAQKYPEEAERSRFMMAVSAGQEHMASYFNILREAKTCAVATIKVIEWKLTHVGWWVKRSHHDYMPCKCPRHNRTPLDVLWLLLAEEEAEDEPRSETTTIWRFQSVTRSKRAHSVQNIQEMRKIQSMFAAKPADT